jgi:TP901 family phage tail tape measure protein
MAQAKLELLLELKNRLRAGLSSAKNSVTSGLTDLKSKLKSFTVANSQAFDAITARVPGVGNAIALLSNPYALAAAAALAFAAAGVAATREALEWQKTMAKVNVTAQLGRNELHNLSNQLLYIGAQGTSDLQEVPQAFNRIISAGLSVNQSLTALQPTLKAAKAGFTDIETVASAGISVMKSSGENINVVYDTLFATLNKGNAEFKDIAQYLPKIIPGARLAGAQLYETAGAFAFLTAQGQTSEQSTTGLMNVFKALSTPRFIDGFKKIGVNVFDTKGEFRGLVPIVEDVQKSMAGLTAQQSANKFALVGLDQEARSAFGSMILNVNELKADIDFTKNSVGQLDQAISNGKTSTEGWARGWNKIKFLAIEFGSLFLPIIDKLGEGFDYVNGLIIDFFIQSKALAAGLFNVVKELGGLLQPIGEAFLNIGNPLAFAQSISKLPSAFNALDFKGAFVKGASDVLKSYSAPGDLTPAAANSADASLQNYNVPGVDGSTNAGNVGQGHQSKSIVINIDALHKGDNKIAVNGEGMSLHEFEKMMNEVLLRLVRNVEASY